MADSLPDQSGLGYDEPGTRRRPAGDTPYSSTGASHWVCRGWTENYAPDSSPHQWMHAYYEVAEGFACGICHATMSDERRWDGRSDPLAEQPRCGGSGLLVEALTPRLDHRDPAFETRESECPGCLDCEQSDEWLMALPEARVAPDEERPS